MMVQNWDYDISAALSAPAYKKDGDNVKSIKAVNQMIGNVVSLLSQEQLGSAFGSNTKDSLTSFEGSN